MLKINYREKIEATKDCKELYLKGIQCLIEKRELEAEKVRENYCRDIFKNPELYRKAFYTMLGWPLQRKGRKRSL